jgi:hypothetical protein
LLKLTASEIESYVSQKLKDTHSDGQSVGLEFVCTSHKSKWCIVLNDTDSGISMSMRSARESVRLFASIDSAYNAISHLTNSITVIGKADER